MYEQALEAQKNKKMKEAKSLFKKILDDRDLADLLVRIPFSSPSPPLTPCSGLQLRYADLAAVAGERKCGGVLFPSIDARFFLLSCIGQHRVWGELEGLWEETAAPVK